MKHLKTAVQLLFALLFVLILSIFLIGCSATDDSASHLETPTEGVKVLTGPGYPAPKGPSIQGEGRATRVPQVQNVRATVTPDGIKIMWDAADGAEGYELYKSDRAAGDFARVASLDGTSYVDNDFSTGEAAYYKVRASKTVQGAIRFGHLSSAAGVLP
ncbi:MAG: hypothetical protein FWE46_02995 [Coriobacteriia bacterium]|nr:hypothetical protein [Coriobacteriia bacterium]MCL2537008.1 hypothetical protein [Coriobacteriia bacterium]